MKDSYIRTKNIYDPNSKNPFKLSRSKIELYTKCPRCFYFDRRLGVGIPQGPAFTLNSAVDTLLKKEFDVHRANGNSHPLMDRYGIDAVPFDHEQMNNWRYVFTGVQYFHKETNLILFGAVDDIWINNKDKKLSVVDYKATSTEKEISLNDKWKEAYKRQMEIYQWLLRKNKLNVSNQGYFVYCNGKTDNEAFDGKLEFDIQIIPYKGNDNWVEKTIIDAHKCLNSNKIPKASPNCEYCQYIKAVKSFDMNLFS